MSKKEKPIVALIYDFDGTFSPVNMREYAFIQAIGKNKEKFWKENGELVESQDVDQIHVVLSLNMFFANKI